MWNEVVVLLMVMMWQISMAIVLATVPESHTLLVYGFFALLRTGVNTKAYPFATFLFVCAGVYALTRATTVDTLFYLICAFVCAYGVEAWSSVAGVARRICGAVPVVETPEQTRLV